MTYLYHQIFYKPLLNLLVFFYNTIAFGDLGLAIILVTLLVRVILYPIFERTARHQLAMQEIQPHLKKIQEDHRHNKEKQVEATMALYRERGVNPFSGFFLLLVQLPILIALYQIFLRILTPNIFGDLYSFVSAPGALNHSLFGLINLEKGSIVVVVLAAIAQYFQARLALPKTVAANTDSSAKTARLMLFAGPAITVLVFWRFPAAVGLYWLITSAFSAVQQFFLNRKLYGNNRDIREKPH